MAVPENKQLYQHVSESCGGTFIFDENSSTHNVGTYWLDTCVGVYFPIDEQRGFCAHISAFGDETGDEPIATIFPANGAILKERVVDKLRENAEHCAWDPRMVQPNCVVVVCPNLYGPVRTSRESTPASRPGTPIPRPDTSPIHTGNLWKLIGPSMTETVDPSGPATPRPRLTGWYIVEAIKEFLKVGREGEPPLHLEVNLQGFVVDHTRVVVQNNTASMHKMKWDPKHIYATAPPDDLGHFQSIHPDVPLVEEEWLFVIGHFSLKELHQRLGIRNEIRTAQLQDNG